MENKTERILSFLYSNKILLPGKCEICKRFEVLPREDFMQKILDKVQVLSYSVVDSENKKDRIGS